MNTPSPKSLTLIVNITGEELEKQVVNHIVETSGIDRDKIAEVNIFMYEDFCDINTYSIYDFDCTSHIVLSDGARIPIRESYVMSALRQCTQLIPAEYSMQAYICPHKVAVDEWHETFTELNLRNYSINVLFTRDASLVPDRDIIASIHEILDCYSFDSLELWTRHESPGSCLITKCFETGQVNLLCKAIESYPKHQAAHPLRLVAFCLLRNHKESLCKPGQAVVDALLNRREELDSAKIEELEEIAAGGACQPI